MSRTKVSIAKYGEYEAFERACRIRRAYERKVFGGVLGATRPAQAWLNEDIKDES